MTPDKDGASGIEVLLDESQADDPLVRWGAVRELGGLARPEVMDALVEALQDDHPFVQWEAARGLGRVGARMHQQGATAALIRLFRPSSRVTSILELLESQAESSKPAQRVAAADALGELRLAPGVATLLKLLRDDDREVRASAALALGKLGEMRAATHLADALRDTDLSVRCAAADALGSIGGPEANTTLLLWLHDRTPMFRGRVVAALGRAGVGIGVVTRALIEVLDDDQPDVRWQAVRALGRAGSPSAIPSLRQLLDDETVLFGVAIGDLAQEAIGRIHHRHPGLWSLLRRLASSARMALRVEKTR